MESLTPSPRRSVRTVRQISSISLDIKAAAEVEKIWILYNLNEDNALEFDEVRDYLMDCAQPAIRLSDRQIHDIYTSIDTDNSGTVSKKELEQFIRLMMGGHGSGVTFKLNKETNPLKIAVRSSLRRRVMNSSFMESQLTAMASMRIDEE